MPEDESSFIYRSKCESVLLIRLTACCEESTENNSRGVIDSSHPSLVKTVRVMAVHEEVSSMFI